MLDVVRKGTVSEENEYVYTIRLDTRPPIIGGYIDLAAFLTAFISRLRLQDLGFFQDFTSLPVEIGVWSYLLISSRERISMPVDVVLRCPLSFDLSRLEEVVNDALNSAHLFLFLQLKSISEGSDIIGGVDSKSVLIGKE